MDNENFSRQIHIRWLRKTRDRIPELRWQYSNRYRRGNERRIAMGPVISPCIINETFELYERASRQILSNVALRSKRYVLDRLPIYWPINCTLLPRAVATGMIVEDHGRRGIARADATAGSCGSAKINLEIEEQSQHHLIEMPISFENARETLRMRTQRLSLIEDNFLFFFFLINIYRIIFKRTRRAALPATLLNVKREDFSRFYARRRFQ